MATLTPIQRGLRLRNVLQLFFTRASIAASTSVTEAIGFKAQYLAAEEDLLALTELPTQTTVGVDNSPLVAQGASFSLVAEELKKMLQKRLQTDSYTVLFFGSPQLMRNAVDYKSYSIVAIVQVPGKEDIYLGVGVNCQYICSEKSYWRTIDQDITQVTVTGPVSVGPTGNMNIVV